MAVTFDVGTLGYVASSTTLTYSHTVASGSNLFLDVMTFAGHAGGATTAVTYNGVSMNEHGTFDSGSKMYDLVAPATGANNVVTTQPSGDMYSSAASFAGVDQTTPLDTMQTLYGSGDLVVTSAVDDMVICQCGDEGGGSTPGTIGGTLISSGYTSPLTYRSEYQAGATSVTWNDTTAGENYERLIAANINAAAAASPEPFMAYRALPMQIVRSKSCWVT